MAFVAALYGLVVYLFFLATFVYAIGFGAAGLTRDLSGESRLFAAEGRLGNVAISIHMLLGGFLSGISNDSEAVFTTGTWSRPFFTLIIRCIPTESPRS